ncbi:RNA polymerase sigma factor (sigma-70 family) [Promicromonospora sp. AC04]|uniref:RNA polymerase sigma factor n=1 Tax=Promicromonospora sp. AC04 TaxID=2135723 RepID=UPI000D3C1C58|nr:sigma-70 family RNA polymerase sigma factor [Promicromonospora sp. AC04]PUB24041.1 RNA polymerase sigma factor (sigma-70 family) [Promicromonospora sp. AC04]
MAQWEAELTELATRRGGALVGYAYSLCRDRGQAEDLVQDALVKVFSRLRRPPGMSDGGQQAVDLDRPHLTNAEAYVRRAILTIYLDGYRRQSHWTGLKHLLADDDRSPGADRVATARVDVGVALAKLSPRQREAVVLRFFEDMTVPQIAQTLGTRPGTITRYLSDAMVLLRGSLAEIVAPAMETDLDERLGTVAGAVRRRRAAKVGAVAGVSMVLAVLLALAALWGPARLLSEPVPPATPSPDAAVGGGSSPTSWHSLGEQYHCDMEVTDLVSSSDTVRLEITGDIAPTDTGPVPGLTAPVRITRTDVEGPALDGGQPLLVFARDGRVVDIGRGWYDGGYQLPGAGQSADDVAEATAATSCGSWTTRGGPWEVFLDQRPAGTYDVYAVISWGDGSGISDVAVSKPVTMEVPAVEMPDEVPLTVDIREGYQPPWLEGTTLACGVYASDIPGGPRVQSERSGLGLESDAAQSGMGLDGDSAGDDVTITFNETEGDAVDMTRTPITLVWLSDGYVVGVGRDVWSDPVEDLQVDAEGETSVVVPVEADRTCLENPDAGMPAGDYDLHALMELDPGSARERQFLSLHAVLGYRVGG